MTAAERTKTTVGVAMATAMAILGVGVATHALSAPVDLAVVDRDTGQVLPIWRHRGRLYVAGQPGARYGLRVTNNTDGRVLVVMSVDGVNILSGETAGYGQRGYVFPAHGSYDVTGWRKSNSEVAAFAFAPLPQSYAARTGRPAEVGVIGMAVFRERVEAPPPEPEVSANNGNALDESSRGYSGGWRAPAPRKAAPSPPPMSAPFAAGRNEPVDSAALARRDERLGTAHGAREWSVVNTVNFERATPYPQFIRQIEYDTYAHLVASGVIHPYANLSPHPRPFPAYPDAAGYVPDPPDEP